jgi:ornithine carbamoyltransferase
MTIPTALKGRSLLTLADITDRELLQLIEFAIELKRLRRRGVRGRRLASRNVALIFEKSSTRTRCAVQVAVSEEGGHAEYLSPHDIHLGHKESVADTARVLGRMFDGIMFRGFQQATVETLARCSGIPVWNGLTDEDHPTQAIADLMTLRESFGKLRGLTVAYIGDGRNNVATALMHGCAKCGVHFVNCTPPELAPAPAAVAAAEAVARRNGATVRVVRNPAEGVRGANALYTDVWVSMGEEASRRERLRLLRPYQVTLDLVRRTGNLERGRVVFLHCLPAFHDAETEATRRTGAQEVTDEVFQAPFSKVFDEAENRMHTTKALIVATVAGARRAAAGRRRT